MRQALQTTDLPAFDDRPWKPYFSLRGICAPTAMRPSASLSASRSNMSDTAADGEIRLTTLAPAAFTHTPWKNGGVVTIDIAESLLPEFAPGSWEGMMWRFGRTAIVTPSVFSDLSGPDRAQVLVSGRGLVLDTPDGEIDVRQPFKPVRFAEETQIVSRLEAGPVEVVNLMGDRSRVSIDLSCLAGGSTKYPGRRVHHLCAGYFLRADDKRKRLRDRDRSRLAHRCRRKLHGHKPAWDGDHCIDFSARADVRRDRCVTVVSTAIERHHSRRENIQKILPGRWPGRIDLGCGDRI
jgi:uncharacterized protein